MRAVERSIGASAQCDDNVGKVIAYMELNYPRLSAFRPRSRALSNTERGTDHRVNGFIEGQKAHVNAGVAGPTGTLALEVTSLGNCHG